MIEILLVKSSVLLCTAMVICWAMRRTSAASRHLVWLCVLTALLVLPVWVFLPAAAIPLAIVPDLVIQSSSFNSLAPEGRSLWREAFVLWFCGVLFFLARLFLDCFRVLSLVRSSRSAEPYGRYSVGISKSLAGPIAWGLGNRHMLLPDAASLWDAERVSIVLLHESTHLRRNDCWALLITEVACALYWCNPLVWFAAAQLRREQELAVDDEVLRSGVDPTTYADHLLAIARVARAPRLAAGAVGRSDLPIRIRAILDPGRNRAMLSRRMILASLAGLIAIALPVASMQTGRKIYKASEPGVIKPKPIEKPSPKYTDEAKEAKIQGAVKLSAVIDIDGKAHDIKVEEGIDEGLDANAVAAVQTWRFVPAQKAGEPVPVSVQIEINFRLVD